MKIKRLFLVFGIIGLFGVCYFYMNSHFDRLSRYPYEYPEARAKIDAKLNDQEIEYLIEYSIAPVEFIKYIDAESFNIYHIDTYHEVSNAAYYLSDLEVVSFSEQILYLNKKEEALEMLKTYYYNEVLDWLYNGDVYNDSAILVKNPDSILTYLSDDYTIGKRVPYIISDVDYIKTNGELKGRELLREPMNVMCAALDEDLKTRNCGNIVVDRAFVSYQKQEELYTSDSEYPCDLDMPGHSEHQLGLALDIKVANRVDFTSTRQYTWLKENAYKYGFIFSYDNRHNHLRYVGSDVSNRMHEYNTSFFQERYK